MESVDSYADFVDVMVAAVGRLVEVTEGRDGVEVPSCPGWKGRDLRAHLANVLLQKVPVLSQPSQTPPDPEDWQRVSPETEGLGEVLVAAAGQVARLLRQLGPGVDVWSWARGDMSTTFWARRLAHEAIIHRVDGELTAGITPTVESGLAADGVGEVLHVFLARPGRPLHDDGPPAVVVMHGSDAPFDWSVQLGADEVVVEPGAGRADCRISGPASELYLWSWGRCGLSQSAVSGDASLTRRLRELAARAT